MKVTADDIAQLLASQPPRRVPSHVRRAAGGGGLWFISLFGLFFGTFGLLFVGIFFPWRIMDDWELDAKGVTTPGVVRSATPTDMSINKRKVMAYGFSYDVPGKEAMAGNCYTTGRTWREGDQVTVVYLPANPSIARIQGARLSKSGGFVGVMVWIFPLIGYGLVAAAWLNHGRTRQLLENGRVAEVAVHSVDATQVRMNRQTVYRITLAPLPETNGQPVVIKRWAPPEVDFLRGRARDQQPVFVLYDPRRPKKVVVPEALIEQS